MAFAPNTLDCRLGSGRPSLHIPGTVSTVRKYRFFSAEGTLGFTEDHEGALASCQFQMGTMCLYAVTHVSTVHAFQIIFRRHKGIEDPIRREGCA